MKIMTMTNTILAASLLFVSCAKDREFESKLRDENTSAVSHFITGKKMIGTANTQSTARFSRLGASPYEQLTEKIVTFEKTENAIFAYEEDRINNEINKKVILKIPVEKYVSYRCAENADKECTNREEENDDIQWYQADYAVLNLEETELGERSPWGGIDFSIKKCYSEIDSKVTHKEINSNIINFEIEKTYQLNDTIDCLSSALNATGDWDTAFEDNSTFKVKLFYSFASLDSVASKNYKTKVYEVPDHEVFGFFKTVQRFDEGNQTERKRYFMNRWNPENKVVTYQLGQAFAKPENAYLKRATAKAFDNMNAALKRGGVNLRVKFEEPRSDLYPGDIRYNFLNLVEDVANRLLGYGPSVANPETGEIIKAHTNMYKGTLESSAVYSYESLRDFEINKAKADLAAKAKKDINLPRGILETNLVKDTPALIPTLGLDARQRSAEQYVESLDGNIPYPSRTKFMQATKMLPNMRYKPMTASKEMRSKLSNFLEEHKVDTLGALTDKDQLELSKITSNLTSYEDQINALNEKGHYTSDKFNFQDLGKVSVSEVNTVKGVRDENGVLKPWDDLGADQKKQLTEILVAHAYIPTLVHEIGHNLGLRHNFHGSHDKANYYKKDDVRALGMKGAPAYSSIMDYGYSDLNELSTFGPYDVAALRYSQNGIVETTAGTMTAASTTLSKQESLRKFEFCTDKDAGTQMTCNRFDEGSNELEILTQKIERYTQGYRYGNKSNRVNNLNDRGNWSYFWRTYMRLVPVRQIHEMWQGYHSYLVSIGYPEIMFSGCPSELRENAADFCSDVDNMITANEKAGRFLIDIIKQPELTCHLQFDAKLADGQEFKDFAMFMPMEEELSNMEFPMVNGKGLYRPTSCFDKNVAPFLLSSLRDNLVRQCVQGGGNPMQCEAGTVIENSKTIGQMGRIHNDVRWTQKDDRDADVGDLEIRGTWIDKMIAMEFLTNRTMMTFAGSSNNMSFTDHPVFRQEIDNMINHFAFNEPLMGQVPVERENGEIYYTSEVTPSINIMTQGPRIKWILTHFFQIPDRSEFPIGTLLLNTARKASVVYNRDINHEDLGEYVRTRSFNNSLEVYKTGVVFEDSAFDESKLTNTYELDNLKVKFGTTNENSLASNAIDQLKSMDQDITTIQKIVTSLNNPTVDESNSEDTPAPATPAAAGTKGNELLAKVIFYKKGYLAMFRDVFEVESTYFASYENDNARQAAMDRLATELGKDRFDNAWRIVVFTYQSVDTNETKLRKYKLSTLIAAQGQESTPEILKSSLESGLYKLPSARSRYPVSLFRN